MVSDQMSPLCEAVSDFPTLQQKLSFLSLGSLSQVQASTVLRTALVDSHLYHKLCDNKRLLSASMW